MCSTTEENLIGESIEVKGKPILKSGGERKSSEKCVYLCTKSCGYIILIRILSTTKLTKFF
jgi:hypothetical protein